MLGVSKRVMIFSKSCFSMITVEGVLKLLSPSPNSKGHAFIAMHDAEVL